MEKNYIEILIKFFEWKEKLNSSKRGDTIYYDIKGYYKYLKENELFNYYLKRKL